MSREALARWRGRLLAAGSGGKVADAASLLLAVGVLVLTGLDKRLETILVEASPAWLDGADDAILACSPHGALSAFTRVHSPRRRA